MKRILILFATTILSLYIHAARYEYAFHDTPISEALTLLVKEHPEANITFIYNELEDYTTSARVSTDKLKEAVKAIVALNPIIVSEKKGHIFVEARQRGRFRYSGQLKNEFGEPVPDATILLLNPKDSVVLTYGMSARDGSFLIPCDRKPVLAKISSSGYQTKIMRLDDTSIGAIRFNTKAIQLDNVNVIVDNVRMEADRTIFVPLQRQKNTAMDGEDLLDQIGIPQIKRNLNGSFETLSGKNVAIFIDFLPASKDDLAGMNLQDVKRVEYLESPSDPRFLGERYVINYIMEQYIYGGYVKLAGTENLNINDQTFSATARFQFKKMTYDIAGYGHYDDLYHNGTTTTETYRFPQQDGEIKTIERLSNTTSSRTNNAIGRVSAKATYSSDHVTARSILSGGLTNTPNMNQNGDVTYSSPAYPNSSFSSLATKKDRFLNFNGSYIFLLPKEINITFTPNYTFSETTQNSTYLQGDYQPIYNGASDHTTNLSGYLNLNRNFGKGGNLTAYLSGNYTYYRTWYSGSANELDRTKEQRLTLGASYSLRAGGFYGEAKIGWIWDRNKINESTSNTSYPDIDLSLSYLFKNVHRLNATFRYYSFAPLASFKSDAVIEETHLLSYTGNPDVKPYSLVFASLSYNWIPSQKGYIAVFTNMWKTFDRFVYEYMPDGDRMIRYIRQPLGDYHIIRIGGSGRLNLLNRTLMLNGSIYTSINKNGAPYNYTHTGVDVRLNATYWLKDFYFSGVYIAPVTYSDGVMVGDLYHVDSSYNLMAGWANKNWNIRFTANNFARWNWDDHRQYFTSPYYDRSFTAYGKNHHAAFSISVTYTFNYGKKLREENELDTRDSSSSGILKN